MSLIDQILSQKIVLVSAGLAILLILAAVGFALFPRIRARRARAVRIRQLKQQQAQVTREAAEQEEIQDVDIPGGDGSALNPTGAKTVVLPSNKPGAAPVVPVVSAPPAPAAPAAPVVSAAASTTKSDEPTPAMQDLLSSVFADEENSARQAILMKGLSPVDINDLLMLCNNIVAQLNGKRPANLVTIKEKHLT